MCPHVGRLNLNPILFLYTGGFSPQTPNTCTLRYASRLTAPRGAEAKLTAWYSPLRGWVLVPLVLPRVTCNAAQLNALCFFLKKTKHICLVCAKRPLVENQPNTCDKASLCPLMCCSSHASALPRQGTPAELPVINTSNSFLW